MESRPRLRILSSSTEPFADRREAGRLLGAQLVDFRGEGTVVLGIPRGGIVVADEVASRLGAAMDIVLARKIGAPGNQELAVASVAEDGRLFADQRILSYLGVERDYLEREKERQMGEMARRVALYRGVEPKVPLAGKTVIVTDDGLATGATMQAALWAVRHDGAGRVVCAVPVAPEDTLRRIAPAADETICLRVPPYFSAVGQFYRHFDQVEDREVLAILAGRRAAGRQP